MLPLTAMLLLLLSSLHIPSCVLSISSDNDVKDILSSQCLHHVNGVLTNDYGK